MRRGGVGLGAAILIGGLALFGASADCAAKGKKTRIVPASGGLSNREISDAMNKLAPKVLECYDTVAKDLENPPSGTVRTSFVVQADGSVSSASIANTTLKLELVESCVLDIVKAARFPKPKGGGTVEVDFPFQFEPDAHTGAQQGKR